MELLTRALKIMTDTISFIQASNAELAQIQAQLLVTIDLKAKDLQAQGEDANNNREIVALRRVASQITDVVNMVQPYTGT